MAAVILHLLFALSTFVLVCHSSWDEVSSLDTLGVKKVKEFITPLARISTNAYTYPSLQAVGDWTLASKVEPLAPKQDAGAQAVLYQGQQQKLVLAFRGTFTQADSCVDVILFGRDALPRGMQLPSKDSCNSRFSSASLDYVSQAANYTRAVLRAYPGAPLLLTGHSLGAALAILVSASLSGTQVLPVVAFSSPGTRRILQEKSLQLAAEQQGRVFVFGDEWDGVMRTLWTLQAGTVCSVEYDEPAACAACSRNAGDGNCRQCLFETHAIDNILQKLDDGSSKLVCEKNVSADSQLRLPQAGAGGSSSGLSLAIDKLRVAIVVAVAAAALLAFRF